MTSIGTNVFFSTKANDTPPSSLDSIANPKVKITERKGVRACSLVRSTSGATRRAGILGWGVGTLTNTSIIHKNLDKPNNKLVNAYLGHFWCTNEPRVNTNSRDSPQPRFGGSHHLPPYSIICAWPRECGGSFPHTFPHSREHEMWLLGFTLGSYLHKPLLRSQTQG